MKHINKLLLLFTSLSIFTGCDNFEKLNTDPDTATTVPSSMLATKVIYEVVRKDRTVKEYVNDGVLAKQIVWNEGVSDLQYNNIGRGDFDGFLQVVNCNDMVTKSPGQKGYEGLALFSKAYLLYYISLNIGDIPYSNAGQGEEGNPRPKYETQKEVMQGILNDLEKLINASPMLMIWLSKEILFSMGIKTTGKNSHCVPIESINESFKKGK